MSTLFVMWTFLHQNRLNHLVRQYKSSTSDIASTNFCRQGKILTNFWQLVKIFPAKIFLLANVAQATVSSIFYPLSYSQCQFVNIFLCQSFAIQYKANQLLP